MYHEINGRNTILCALYFGKMLNLTYVLLFFLMLFHLITVSFLVQYVLHVNHYEIINEKASPKFKSPQDFGLKDY